MFQHQIIRNMKYVAVAANIGNLATCPKKKIQHHLKICTVALFWCVTKEAKNLDMTYFTPI